MVDRPGMRRLPAAAVLAALLAALLPAGSGNAATAGQVLGSRIEAALRNSTARALATHVVVDGVGTVHARNATAALPPASTEKNFVGYAALDRLGADHRFVTEVRATVVPDERGVVAGDLVLVADGDPTLRGSHLTDLAVQLRQAGVRHVTGTLFGDDSKYDRARRAPGWKWSWVPHEVGALSAFVLDRNTWRGDAAFLADPAAYNLGRFRAALTAAGISVNSGPQLGSLPGDLPLLAAHESAPLAPLVRSMLKNSDNLLAEILLKELAAAGGVGSTAAGAAVLRQHAARYGIALGTVADGSGLSSYNRQSPLAQTMWLRVAHANPAFRQALPVACKDGTLRTRFCGTAAAGRVWAKTGTLSGVRTLAGYTMTRNGRLVRFSFQISGATSGLAAKNAIDRAVVAIASSSV